MKNIKTQPTCLSEINGTGKHSILFFVVVVGTHGVLFEFIFGNACCHEYMKRLSFIVAVVGVVEVTCFAVFSLVDTFEL